MGIKRKGKNWGQLVVKNKAQKAEPQNAESQRVQIPEDSKWEDIRRRWMLVEPKEWTDQEGAAASFPSSSSAREEPVTSPASSSSWREEPRQLQRLPHDASSTVSTASSDGMSPRQAEGELPAGQDVSEDKRCAIVLAEEDRFTSVVAVKEITLRGGKTVPVGAYGCNSHKSGEYGGTDEHEEEKGKVYVQFKERPSNDAPKGGTLISGSVSADSIVTSYTSHIWAFQSRQQNQLPESPRHRFDNRKKQAGASPKMSMKEFYAATTGTVYNFRLAAAKEFSVIKDEVADELVSLYKYSKNRSYQQKLKAITDKVVKLMTNYMHQVVYYNFFHEKIDEATVVREQQFREWLENCLGSDRAVKFRTWFERRLKLFQSQLKLVYVVLTYPVKDLRSRLARHPEAISWNLLWAVIQRPSSVDRVDVCHLLMNGFKLDVTAANFKHRQTPLFFAARYGDASLVQFMLTHSSDIHHRDDYQLTALYFACMFETEASYQIVELLLASRAEPNAYGFAGRSPLVAAVRSGDVKGVQLLLDAAADINHKDDDQQSALFSAHDNLVELLAQHIPIDAPSATGLTALHTACDAGDFDKVSALLQCRASANACDNSSRTPLFNAVEKGWDRICSLLVIDGGANPLHNDCTSVTPMALAQAADRQQMISVFRDPEKDMANHIMSDALPGTALTKPLKLSVLAKHETVRWQWLENGRLKNAVGIGLDRPLTKSEVDL